MNEAIKRNVDLYSLLKVDREATDEDIHRAYKSLSTSFHPDKLPPTTSAQDREEIQQMFLEFKRANDILMDPVLRLAYDHYGEDGVSLIKHIQSHKRERETRQEASERNDDSDGDSDEEAEDDKVEASLYERVERLLGTNPLEAKQELQRFMEQHDYHQDLTEQNQVQLGCSVEFPPVTDLKNVFFDGRDYLKFVGQRVAAQARQAPPGDRKYYKQRIQEEQGLVDYQINQIKDAQKGSVGFTLSSLQPRNVKTKSGAMTPPKWSMAMGASTDVVYPTVAEIAKLTGKEKKRNGRNPASTFINMVYQPVPNAQINMTANLSNDQSHQFVLGTARNFLNRSSHRYSLTFLAKSPLTTNMILNYKSFRHIKDIGMASGGISMGANGQFLSWNAKWEASKGTDVNQKISAKIDVGVMRGNSAELSYRVKGMKSKWLQEFITIPKQLELTGSLGTFPKVEAMVTQEFSAIATHPTLGFGLEHDIRLSCWTWVWELSYSNSSFKVPIPVLHLGTITNPSAYYAEKLYYGMYCLLVQSMAADILQEEDKTLEQRGDEETTKKLVADLSNKKTKQDGLKQLTMMESIAEQKVYEEQQRSGLVILQATYWLEQYSGVEMQVATMDATRQLQFWVSGGKLSLPAIPKSSLLGFYDLQTELGVAVKKSKWDWRIWRRWTRRKTHPEPTKGAPKLRIRYTHEEYVYEVTISEHEALTLPSTTARLLGHASVVQ